VGLVLLGVASLGGCEKRERPKSGRPAAAEKDRKSRAAENAAEKQKAAQASPAEPGEGGFAVEVDAAKEAVKVVASKEATAPLSSILDQAYKKDKSVTSKTVKSWVTDNDVLSAQDVRDLLEASWNKDSAKATDVLRPWFVEKMTLEISDIPALLTKAWGYDMGATRDVLRTWGDGRGFVDVSDSEALARHKFVVADDVDQIRKAVREYHGNNWTQVAGVPVGAKGAEGGAKELQVQISWAASRWIGPKEIRFSASNNKELAAKLNTPVTVAPRNLPDAGIPVVLDAAVDLPENWVQVQDADFVVLAAKTREVPAPERNSKEWKSLLGLGVIPGSLYF
jgi:hypothetical protein